VSVWRGKKGLFLCDFEKNSKKIKDFLPVDNRKGMLWISAHSKSRFWLKKLYQKRLFLY